MTPQSNCHGRPRRRWQTDIGTTTYSKVSSYAPILKETWTVCSTRIVPEWLSRWTLYGCGCFILTNWSLEHSSSLAKLWQLPPSMMTLIDLPLMSALVWKRLHRWSSQCWCWVVNTFVTTRIHDSFSEPKHKTFFRFRLPNPYMKRKTNDKEWNFFFTRRGNFSLGPDLVL